MRMQASQLAEGEAMLGVREGELAAPPQEDATEMAAMAAKEQRRAEARQKANEARARKAKAGGDAANIKALRAAAKRADLGIGP